MPSPHHDEVAVRLASAIGLISRKTRPVHGELSIGHFSTLATLERRGPSRPSDVARIERMSAPTVTRLISVLEARGLVERTQSTDDARSVVISLTATGAEAVREARAERAAAISQLLEILDEGQVDRLEGVLDILETVARAALDDGSADETP